MIAVVSKACYFKSNIMKERYLTIIQAYGTRYTDKISNLIYQQATWNIFEWDLQLHYCYWLNRSMSSMRHHLSTA